MHVKCSYEPFDLANARKALSEPAIDSVRGKPGVIGIVNGRTYTATTAEWFENGLSWSASSMTMTPEEMAAALDPLTLDRTNVSDPSGNLHVIGEFLGGQEDTQLTRDTTIKIRDRSSVPVKTYGVGITGPRPGSTGLDDEFVSSARLGELNGRQTIELDPDSLVTTLDDGSRISVSATSIDGSHMDIDMEVARRIARSIRRRTPADDDVMMALPLGWSGFGITTHGYIECIEDDA